MSTVIKLRSALYGLSTKSADKADIRRHTVPRSIADVRSWHEQSRELPSPVSNRDSPTRTFSCRYSAQELFTRANWLTDAVFAGDANNGIHPQVREQSYGSTLLSPCPSKPAQLACGSRSLYTAARAQLRSCLRQIIAYGSGRQVEAQRDFLVRTPFAGQTQHCSLAVG